MRPLLRIFASSLLLIALSGLADAAKRSEAPRSSGWLWSKPSKPQAYRGREIIGFKTSEAPGTIIIETAEHRLYLVLPGGKAMRYAVGVGREGFGWQGTARIARRAEWPDWHPPKEMIERAAAQSKFIPYSLDGGRLNPLGARALYLYQGSRDTLYRIHGTNEPRSIGRNVSSGCIRLLNEDVIDLYDRVGIGTKVIVR
jgi:lipoprotein-anchoring transpeptidase ErfK/SrfK